MDWFTTKTIVKLILSIGMMGQQTLQYVECKLAIDTSST